MDALSEILIWATGLIDSLTALVTDSPVTYLIIFAMAAIDVVVPIVPAEATVTAAAVLAGQGTLNIIWVMVAAGLGAFVGDNVGYWIGRLAGRPLVERILRGRYTDQIDRVQVQFDRRGGLFIIVGRFIPGGRSAVAVSAGVLQFGWIQFMIYDAIAAVIWSFQAALPGFIGGSLIQDRPWLAMIFGFVLSGLMALAIALGQRWWERRGLRLEPIGDADGVDSAEGLPGISSGDQAGLSRRVVSRVAGIPEGTIEAHERPAGTPVDDTVDEAQSDAAPELEAK
jgi:membrane protein DedA with SNARE-associated domain